MLFDKSQVLTINSFFHIFTLLVILALAFLVFYQLKIKEKVKNQIWEKYLPFYHFVGVSILWVVISFINYLTLNPIISLWGARLAFAIAPAGFIGAFKLFWVISQKNSERMPEVIQKLHTAMKIAVFVTLGLPILDPYVVTGSIPHTCVGCSDVPQIGLHAGFYLLFIIAMFGILIYEYLFFLKHLQSEYVKKRLKIVAYTILISTFIIIVLNVFLPYFLHITTFMDYGIVSAAIIVLGFYLALENKWTYSLKFLISKHILIWGVGLILFVAFWLYEVFTMFILDNANILNNINFYIFGLLYGILVGYLYTTIIKYRKKIGLLLIYRKFWQLQKDITRVLEEAVDNKIPQLDSIKKVLKLIADFLEIKEVCIVDTDPTLIEPYSLCAYDDKKINIEVMTQYIRIPLLKTRFLVINIEDKFISKEIVEFIKEKALTLNALINLNIINTTLKDINSKLAQAVVNRTNKLKNELEVIEKQFANLKTDYASCKQMFPVVVGDVGFSAKMSLEYVQELSRKIPDDFELRFAVGRLHEQLLSIKASLHRILIFSDVVIRGKVYKQNVDMKKYMRDLLDAWQSQFDNKTIGLVRDLVPGKLPINLDLDKVNFVVNSIIGYMLVNLKHGYLHVIQRKQPGGAIMQFKAIAEPAEYGFSPVTDQKLLQTIKAVLDLSKRIIELHDGQVFYTFENGILKFFEFSIAKD